MEAELTMIEQKRNKEKVKKVHNRQCYKQLTLESFRSEFTANL